MFLDEDVSVQAWRYVCVTCTIIYENYASRADETELLTLRCRVMLPTFGIENIVSSPFVESSCNYMYMYMYRLHNFVVR